MHCARSPPLIILLNLILDTLDKHFGTGVLNSCYTPLERTGWCYHDSLLITIKPFLRGCHILRSTLFWYRFSVVVNTQWECWGTSRSIHVCTWHRNERNERMKVNDTMKTQKGVHTLVAPRSHPRYHHHPNCLPIDCLDHHHSHLHFGRLKYCLICLYWLCSIVKVWFLNRPSLC